METDAVLRLLQDVAAEVIDPRFRALAEGEIGEKGPGDLVTVADLESERLITAALVAAYPDAVVLGEEAVAAEPALLDRYAAAEHAFTLDPVDGTKNFVAGSPDHAVMVAELRGGEVTRSWIWHPQHRTAYVAERGAGAYRTRDAGAPERLTRDPAGPEPDRWRGVTSRRSWVGRRLGDLAPLELTWVCCGVDYARLVEGEADALVYAKSKPWDHAPGALLLSEAGGHHGTTDGAAYRPREAGPGIVAAADRHVYDAVVAGLAGQGSSR